MGRGFPFQCLRRGFKKEGDRIFGRVCCDRVRGNDFKLELVRLRLDNKEEVFYGKSSEALE